MRDIVGGDTPNIRAICAAVFRSEMTASAISRRLVSSSFLPATNAALCPRGGQPSGRSFSDYGALELGEGAHHMHHPPGRRGGVSPKRWP